MDVLSAELDVDSDGAQEELSDKAESENEAPELLAGQLHHHAVSTELNEQEPEVFAGVDSESNDEPSIQSHINSVSLTQQFIQQISTANLDNGKLDDSVISRLRKPETGPIVIDADQRLSLDIFLGCINASQATYNAVRVAILRRFPGTNVLSYHLVKNLTAKATGVVSVLDDMCINSCQAFTGPLAHLTTCSVCGEQRYMDSPAGKGPQPRQRVCTIPLGPQIQALRRSQNNALALRYRDKKMKDIIGTDEALLVYDDIFSGSDFLDFTEHVQLGPHDITVSFSLDGAQLYQNKKSDTWIAIWIINEYDPSTRYKRKHVLPALIIPGPNKPKNIDSFVFRSFHHLSALQRENDGRGIYVWDNVEADIVSSRIMFLFATADAVGLTEIDGRVGHHGTHGCRLSCGMKGRRKPHGGGHYYATHLCPNECVVEDSNHADYNFHAPPKDIPPLEDYRNNLIKVINSQTQVEYEQNRKLTGISKPSLLSGLHPDRTLPVPRCFTIDLMHLLFINLGELLIPLWRGTLPCETTDDKTSWDWVTLVGNTWLEHGKLVAAATKYFPSSFHRPPRNPAEKISSGYKAVEYFLYLFGLGPALFRTVLPQKYWRHFCKLVHGVRIITQRRISVSHVREAHFYLIQFVEEYENLYYQRRMDRLHFCRPCLHTLVHTASEVTRVGPGTYLTQFTMERAIGDLGGDIRQPSNIYGNLCQIALRQSQLNALKALYPEFDPDTNKPHPAYSEDIGHGYVLLRPRDRGLVRISGAGGDKISNVLGRSEIRRWGRLQLPNGQVARSLYKEDRSTQENQRVSRNVKVRTKNL